jgi:hypothetical protein
MGSLYRLLEFQISDFPKERTIRKNNGGIQIRGTIENES